MAASVAAVKTFYGLIGKTLTDAQVIRLKKALETQRYGQNEDGSPREATADDYIDWCWRQSAAFINRVTEQEARAAVVVDPEDLLD